MREALILVAVVLMIAVTAQYVEITDHRVLLSSAESTVPTNVSEELLASVLLTEGMNREGIAGAVATALGYDERTRNQFHDTYRSMQWMEVSDVLVPHIVEKYELTEADREVLLTHSTVYLDRTEDILESLYVSQEYTLPADATVVEAAEALVAPLRKDKETLIPELLNDGAVAELLGYVRSENELLPDLVPLPPQDIAVKKEGDKTLLIFTTVYYNQGTGPLELRADPSTIGVIGDFDREVFQRIYKEDGSYRERTAGTFEWHNEHLHYHFIDFIEYKLASLDTEHATIEDILAEKSTFCIRDISRVYLKDVDAPEAAYRICGRERQGVSVGWGDAYFNTYVDQNLDITGLPTGTYRLSFHANPADRFDEVTKNNNVSYTDIYYNADEMTVQVLSHEPSVLPEFEHIHVEQKL